MLIIGSGGFFGCKPMIIVLTLEYGKNLTIFWIAGLGIAECYAGR